MKEQVEELTFCFLQSWASEKVPVVSFILTHNALHIFERHKGRKCDPGLITVGVAISENSQQTRRCLFAFLLVVLSDVEA